MPTTTTTSQLATTILLHCVLDALILGLIRDSLSALLFAISILGFVLSALLFTLEHGVFVILGFSGYMLSSLFTLDYRVPHRLTLRMVPFDVVVRRLLYGALVVGAGVVVVAEGGVEA